jgi:uncharacterized protein
MSRLAKHFVRRFVMGLKRQMYRREVSFAKTTGYRRLRVGLLLFCLFSGFADGQQEVGNDSNIEALTRAIHMRRFDRAREILESNVGLNLNAIDKDGSTPLLEAIALHSSDIAKRLIGAGADPNLAGSGGTSPLIQASFYCDVEVAEFLLRDGAAVNAADKHGETALTNAALNCIDGKLVRLLIAQGAGVNMRTKDRETPLTVAAFSGNYNAVEELVAAGADVNAKTDEKETAMSLACGRKIGRKKGHDRICALLRTAK